jgi:hypothetical protein
MNLKCSLSLQKDLSMYPVIPRNLKGINDDEERR